MADQRPLVITIMAVFLALGLGLLLGGTMLGEGAVVSQQRQVIARLEGDSARMSEENHLFGARLVESENALRVYREFGRKALPSLIYGRLTGRTVAIVSLDSDTIIDKAAAALRQAGADILSVTTLTDGFDLRPADRRSAAADYLALAEASPNELVGRLVDALAAAVIGSATAGPDLGFLEDAGFIHRSGRYDRRPAVVLVVGGDHGGERNTALVDDRLLAAVISEGLRVVLAERSDSHVSTIVVGQKRGVPTIDNLDTTPGQAALVFALAGEAGDFGQKATAREVVPELGR
ncbi:MAG: copper transporter [Bacillota bacterium]